MGKQFEVNCIQLRLSADNNDLQVKWFITCLTETETGTDRQTETQTDRQTDIQREYSLSTATVRV